MSAVAETRSITSPLEAARWQGLAAVIAGPVFLAIVTALTLAELDFMHRLGWGFTRDDHVPWPSGLVLGDYGALQIANFAVTGLLLAFFAVGFRRELPRSRSGRGAGILLLALALAVVAAAFPTDRATAAGESPESWHGYVHLIGFVALALTSLLAPLALALALRGHARWRRYPRLLIAAVALEIVFFFPLDFLGDPAFVAYMIVLFGWLAVLGARLRRLS